MFNIVARHIGLINSNSGIKKTGQIEEIFYLSGLVAKTGVEPVTSGL